MLEVGQEIIILSYWEGLKLTPTDIVRLHRDGYSTSWIDDMSYFMAWR